MSLRSCLPDAPLTITDRVRLQLKQMVSLQLLFGQPISEGSRACVDDLHDPGKMAPFIGPARLVKDSENTKPSRNFSWLGVANTLMVLAIVCALLFIFAGWPLMNHFSQDPNMYNQGANMSGQVPEIDFGPSNGLIDRDTPQDRRVITGFNGDEYHLVFSDEFNGEGPRSELEQLHV